MHEDPLDAPRRRTLARAHVRPRGRVHGARWRGAGADGIPHLPAPPLRPGAPHRQAAGSASDSTGAAGDRGAGATGRARHRRAGRARRSHRRCRRDAGQRRAQLPRHGADVAPRRLRDDGARAVELPAGNRRARGRADGPVHAQGRQPLQPPGVAARAPASTSGTRRRSASRRSSGACSTSSSRCARSSSRPRSRTSPGSSCSRTASYRAASRRSGRRSASSS